MRTPSLLLLGALSWVCQCAAILFDVECNSADALQGANSARGAMSPQHDSCVGEGVGLVQVAASAIARTSSSSGAAALGAAGAAAASEAATQRTATQAGTAIATNATTSSNISLAGVTRLNLTVTDSMQEAVVTLQKMVTTQGDFTQGLIFTLIAVIIVIGIYLLLCTEIRPGEVDLIDVKQPYPGMRREPAYSMRPSLGPGTVAGSQRSALSVRQVPMRASDRLLPVPGTSEGAFGGAAGAGLVGLQSRRTPRWDDWHPELPKVYPTLVIPNSHTRLAVPLEALAFPSFEIDVLGMSGVPLLCATLQDGGVGSRSIEISLHSVGKLLAIVNEPGLEIHSADGALVGQLVRDEHLRAEGPQYTLRDAEGRPYLTINSSNPQDNRDFKVSSMVNGKIVERATAIRRAPGKLPAEHYEVDAHKNVDAVLILACLLAAVVFGSPQSHPAGSSMQVPSGRPSMSMGFGTAGQFLPSGPFMRPP
mmetsp:Transcript_16286/g.42095  ORF Transcript_16286/g.42095 Transcript_16286/m.42095 type:complete len:479 (-) Transcript_16286:178-1614(-)